MNFLFKVVKSLNINAQIVTNIDHESLTGTSETVKEYDPKQKKDCKIIKIIPGALDPTPEQDRDIIDVLIMNEADVLFDLKSTKKTKEAMLDFQITLNPMGTDDNIIGVTLPDGNWHEFNPECSLFFVSYPPDNFYDTIVKRGFLQRMIVIFNMLSIDDRIGISKELTDMLESNKSKDSEYDDLIEKLAYVNEYWSTKDGIQIKIDKKARRCLKNLVDEIFLKLNNINERPRKSLEEFTQRWIEHTWKLAWHHMILRLDDTLMPEDVEYAREYMMPIWTTLIGLFEAGFTPAKDKNRREKRQLADVIEMYENICKRDGVKSGERISRNELVDRLSKQWELGDAQTLRRINKFEQKGWFRQSKRGYNMYISLARMPEWYKNKEITL
ncbi:MAG: hypothetical protein ACTSSE_16105 [Candidatus Thorarchaeota archaeon]